MAILTRSQVAGHGDTIQLRVSFKDSSNNLVDLDTFPTITIVQPSGLVYLAPTSTGVFRESVGVYGYDLAIPLNFPIGVWADIWSGTLDGYTAVAELQFIVHNTQLPMINSDGYVALGDDPGTCYSQDAIRNINLLLKTLKARLKSAGKATMKDEFGNDVLVDCDIYSVDSLVSFLANSITAFNQIPHFTFFTFEDTEFIQIFHDVLVQGATLMAVSSQGLIERGREFQFTDNGINFNPPTMSEILQSQWSAELQNHYEKLKLIKSNLKPSPIGLGVLSISTSRSPAIRRLRHLRARQIF